MLPLSLYVHFPWCVRKCPYCDFNSHQAREEIPQGRYIQTLLADLERLLSLVWGRPVSSIYCGGGTPSLFSGDALATLLAGLRARLPLTPGCEITLEANPGTVEHDRFEVYRQAGINRISLGVQSFQDDALQRLGRIHDGGAARTAIMALREAGFDNFNLDLMHGLPGQTREMAMADIDLALSFRPPHLSYYQLTIEPNTAYAANPPQLPEEDTLANIQDACQDRIRAQGMAHYEVSAWSLPGYESRHNLNYWRFGDYLGIGAGAHGKITQLSDMSITRYGRQRHPQQYMRAAETGRWNIEERLLSEADVLFEYFFNGLRLREGVDVGAIGSRAGVDPDRAWPLVGRAVGRGLLEVEGTVARATALGWRFMNDLQAMFLPESKP